jgi:hypothetical protein
LILCACALRPTLADDAQPIRVTTYIASAQNVLDDLNYMVSELAGEPGIWEEKVYPNIDIFLIGLDFNQPIRFDGYLDPDHDKRNVLMLPLAEGDAKIFLDENLEPIGIFNNRLEADGRPPKGVFWELESDPAAPVFDGWMRSAHGYGFISPVESDLPKTIEAPDATHAHLVERGVDLAIELISPQPNEADRVASFNRIREKILGALEPYDDETAEEFEVRSLIVNQQFERLEVLFTQTNAMSAAWTLNDGMGLLEVLVDPAAGTQLESDFQSSQNRESFFARVPTQENGVLSGRLNMLLSDTLKEHFSTFYTQAIPAVHGQIDEREGYTPEQRQARKDAMGILLQMLADNAADGNVDAFVEISAAGNDQHTMVSGLTFASSDPISELLQAIVKFGEGWTLEENVTTIGNVTVHKLHAGGDYPVSLAEFFGPDGDYYVGVDGTHVWVAAGVNSLDALTTAIGQVTDETREPAPIPLFQLDFQVRPIVKMAHAWEGESAVDLMAFFKKGGFANQTRERENAANTGDDEEEPLTEAFKDFNWQQIMLDTLEGSEARVETTFKFDAEASIIGRTVIETDVLEAVGEIIAEFADEQL